MAAGERGKRDRVPYALWRDQGLLEATPGRDIDKGFVARRLAELPGRYDTRALAYNGHHRWRKEELRPPRGPLLELIGHHIGRVQGVA